MTRDINSLPAGTVQASTDHVVYTLGDVTVRAAWHAEILYKIGGELQLGGVPLDLCCLPSYVPVRLGPVTPGRYPPPWTHGVRLRGRGGSTYALIEALP